MKIQLDSLRTRLLRQVLVPLVATWLFGDAIMVAVAYGSTSQALDRALLDDAYAVAAHVHTRDGRPRLDLSDEEVSTVLFDRMESTVFALLTDKGEIAAGDPRLQGRGDKGSKLAGALLEERDGLRTASVTRSTPVPYRVVVGQTTGERTVWLRRLLVYSTAPTIGLLLLLGWWLWHSVAEELAPLARLQRTLEERNPSDLSDVPAGASSSEVAALGEAINGLMQRIAGSVQAQREFAGNVAHELRTPLAGIRASAEYGLAHDDPAEWKQQLRVIVASQDRASRCVDQLLALALADEAAAGLPLQPLRIDELVSEIVLRLMPRADRLGIDLGAHGLDSAVHAHAHVALLECALNNLLDNAFVHGRPPTGCMPIVTVSVAHRNDGRPCITVSDNGPGLEPSAVDMLLGRWKRGQAPGGQGSGLGLSIVVRYCTLLGGSLELGRSSTSGLAATLVLQPADAPA